MMNVTSMKNTLKENYFESTRTPMYSLIFTLPLLGLYELGLLLISRDDIPNLRNAADVLMKQIMEQFGLFGLYGFGFLFIFGFLFVYFIQRKSWSHIHIRGNYFIFMLAESILWAWVLYYFMLLVQSPFLMTPHSRIIIQQVVLSIGAGIYEEFIFRVILITGLMSVLHFVMQWSIGFRRAGAIVIAAVLFSLFHFIGVLGESPSIALFLIRFFAGVFLGVLYSVRGFGITACAHGVYDLILVTQSLTELY